MTRCWLCAGGHFGEQQARLGNGVMQVGVLWRILDVDTAGNHRDGAAGQRAIMRRGVNSARQAGHNDLAICCQLL